MGDGASRELREGGSCSEWRVVTVSVCPRPGPDAGGDTGAGGGQARILIKKIFRFGIARGLEVFRPFLGFNIDNPIDRDIGSDKGIDET